MQLTDPAVEEEDVATSSAGQMFHSIVTPASFRNELFAACRRKLFTCWNNSEKERESGREGGRLPTVCGMAS